MRTSRSWTRWRWLLVVSALIIAACGDDGDDATSSPETGEAASEQTSDRDGTLRLAWTVPPDQWDPVEGSSQVIEYTFHTPIYDRLWEIKPDGTVSEMLATDWELAEDNSSITIELREGVNFHDGTPFNAEAVKLNIERAQAKEGSLAAEAYNLVTGIEVLDEHTIRLDLTGDPLATEFPMRVAMTAATGIASPAALDDPEALATTPAGSGLYELAEQTSDRAIYQRVPGYWDEELDASAPERMEIIAIEEQNARINALTSGAVDSILFINATPEEHAAVPDEGFQVVRFPPSHRSQLLVVNTTREPFDDPEVKRALSLAVDREAIAGLWADCVPSVQVSPEGTVGHVPELDDPDRLARDVDAAREIFEQAGLTERTVSIVSNGAPQSLTVLEEQLSAAGLQVELNIQVPATTISTWREGNDDLLWLGSAMSPDPALILADWFAGVFSPGGAPAELEELTRDARVLPYGSDERDEAFQEANRYLAENPHHTIVCSHGTSYAASDRVIGVDRQFFGANAVMWDTRYVSIAAE